MNLVDLRYINILSTRLDRFKRKTPTLFEFRCPLCGDSKKSKLKTRGNIYEDKNSLFFKCHNCGKSLTLAKFIEEVNPSLYDEYRLEKFFKKKKERENESAPTRTTHIFRSYDMADISGLIPISTIDDCVTVKHYIIDRQIPKAFHDLLFISPHFKGFINSLLPDLNVPIDEIRLVIPFFDENKKVFALSCRSFNKNSQLRYMNVTLDNSKPKVYGIDRWNKKEKTYVVEGALDSLFLPNCIATAGGDLTSTIENLCKYYNLPKDQFVIIYDNEPRSKTTRDKIKKAIQHEFNTVIWPNYIHQKDINKMVTDGISSEKIKNIIDDNIFNGLSANLQLSFWK